MSISNAMIQSNDGGKPYMKEKNESKEKNKTRNEDKNEGKIIRVLEIYTRLLNGAVINKEEEAERYRVAKRSIQRDIDSIREYLRRTDNKSGVYDLVNYDYRKKGYCLEHIYKVKLKSSEILAICKILLESRSMTKREMTDILDNPEGSGAYDPEAGPEVSLPEHRFFSEAFRKVPTVPACREAFPRPARVPVPPRRGFSQW